MSETYSRFGGLWIDRLDGEEVLSEKLRNGELSPKLGELIRSLGWHWRIFTPAQAS